MTREIRKAAVIGAGSMGSGIAAQLTNAGVDVYLLDIVPKDSAPHERNRIAEQAVQRLLKATPATDPLNAGFMDPDNAKRITPGNIEDHLAEAVRDADWVIEVVLENLAIKLDLYEKLETLVKPGAIISSNTSTIPLKDLVVGRSDEFKKHFLITHFFNPPRFMHLLELVAGEQTLPEVMETMQVFGDVHLGKNTIICKDTPAFLANRIGIYFMFRAITESIDRQMKIEEADAVLGSPIGFPKEGIFGLLDLVGIGIIPLVTESLLKTLPNDDPFRAFDHDKGLSLVNSLLKNGCTGRNSPKGGFYRMHKREDGSKQKQAVSLSTGDYYDVEKTKLKSVKAAKKHGPRAVFESDDALGQFAWVVVRDTLLYAAYLLPEIADDIADVDAALRGGYNAQWGPFELIDKLGVEWFTRKVQEDGLPLPPSLKLAANRPFYKEQDGQLFRLQFDFAKNHADYAPMPAKAGVLKLVDIKRKTRPLISHYSASLWDIGDGVTCLEFHSKMNTLDPSVLWVINQSVEFVKNHASYRAMVIYNEERNFSLGANLGLVDAALKLSNFPLIQMTGLSGLTERIVLNVVEAMIYQGQSVFKSLKDAPFPVIGAPNGMALGGGCEILLHCDSIQASAETYMGLVESGVGLIPAWGGCARYLERCQSTVDIHGPLSAVRKAFQAIIMPQNAVSTSAQDARKKAWLRPQDGITMNADRLLADAKAKAMAMADGYHTPQPAIYKLPGPSGKAALNLAIDDFYTKGDATYHDVVVADALSEALTGGETHPNAGLDENTLAQLERENFLSLLKTSQTQKRIAHTLKTGKPLREESLENPKTLDDIRALRKQLHLRKKALHNTPLQGGEAFKLKLMADVTAMLLKQVAR